MFNARLLGNGRCHGYCIMADMSETLWDATTQVSSKSEYWQASYGISNIFHHGGRPPSWIGILLFWTTHEVNHAVRFTMSKFDVDPIFPAGDIAILWFCQFGRKMPNHDPFLGFWGVEFLKIVGRHPDPEKAHP